MHQAPAKEDVRHLMVRMADAFDIVLQSIATEHGLRDDAVNEISKAARSFLALPPPSSISQKMATDTSASPGLKIARAKPKLSRSNQRTTRVHCFLWMRFQS